MQNKLKGVGDGFEWASLTREVQLEVMFDSSSNGVHDGGKGKDLQLRIHIQGK